MSLVIFSMCVMFHSVSLCSRVDDGGGSGVGGGGGGGWEEGERRKR